MIMQQIHKDCGGEIVIAKNSELDSSFVLVCKVCSELWVTKTKIKLTDEFIDVPEELQTKINYEK